MYHDLRQLYWWSNMKQDITRYIAECDICGRFKANHLRRPGFLQPLPIPVWKWEDISMDFITGLPRTAKGHDSIWVIVGHLTKTAHFLPVGTRYIASQYAKLYFDRIVTLHGVPLTIVSDRGADSCRVFGYNSKNALVFAFSEVQPIIPRPMVRQRG
jgi:hypothetical protein